MSFERVILNITNEPRQQLYLCRDETSKEFFLRNIWLTANGEAKVRTIPLSGNHLVYLREYLNTTEFSELL